MRFFFLIYEFPTSTLERPFVLQNHVVERNNQFQMTIVPHQLLVWYTTGSFVIYVKTAFYAM